MAATSSRSTAEMSRHPPCHAKATSGCGPSSDRVARLTGGEPQGARRFGDLDALQFLQPSRGVADPAGDRVLDVARPVAVVHLLVVGIARVRGDPVLAGHPRRRTQLPQLLLFLDRNCRSQRRRSAVLLGSR
ncbi:hypothetical protein [Streptomyces viridochromogenes]